MLSQDPSLNIVYLLYEIINLDLIHTGISNR